MESLFTEHPYSIGEEPLHMRGTFVWPKVSIEILTKDNLASNKYRMMWENFGVAHIISTKCKGIYELKKLERYN